MEIKLSNKQSVTLKNWLQKHEGCGKGCIITQKPTNFQVGEDCYIECECGEKEDLTDMETW